MLVLIAEQELTGKNLLLSPRIRLLHTHPGMDAQDIGSTHSVLNNYHDKPWSAKFWDYPGQPQF